MGAYLSFENHHVNPYKPSHYKYNAPSPNARNSYAIYPPSSLLARNFRTSVDQMNERHRFCLLRNRRRACVLACICGVAFIRSCAMRVSNNLPRCRETIRESSQ